MIKESPDGALTMTCFAGCDRKEILEKLGITFNDLRPSFWRGGDNIEETYTYVNAQGKYVFEKVRLIPKGFRLCRFESGTRHWNLKGISLDKQPLYRLPEVIADIKQNKIIVFVEGEKDVERLRRLDIPATTLSGGANDKIWFNGSGRSAIKVLSKGRVVFIPDNDEPGIKFAKVGNKKLRDSAILELEGLSKAGDVSDWLTAGGTKEHLVELIDKAYSNKPEAPEDEEIKHDMFFKPRGYDRGIYYFMSYLEQQIVELSDRDFSRKTTLFRLAPKKFWEDEFPSSRGAIDLDCASDYLMQKCRVEGIYNYRSIRGRGVWMDDSRVVIHSGDHLIVDGEQHNLTDFKSSFVYERERIIPLTQSEPMKVDQGNSFVDLCTSINWEDEVSGKLFAGWMFLAPICGALRWRPHIWIIGAAGSGKTWIFSEIIERLFNGMAVFTQSTTTEAGLRQDVRNDAIPIIFDEAESDSRKNKAIIDKVLELARQASSDTGGVIMKGSTGGKAVFFNVSSMFCFISVNKDYLKKADQSRIASFPLCPPLIRGVKTDRFEKLVKMKNELMDHTFRKGFIARSCNAVNEVRRNSELISSMFQGQIRRDIDQYGSMIAGLWSLTHNGNIEQSFVEDIIHEISHAESIDFDDGEKDEIECLSTIMECVISVTWEETQRIVRRDKTIGELIEYTDPYWPGEQHDEAQEYLKQYGIKTNKDGVYIANQNTELQKLLNGTRFQYGWSTHLPRIPGSKKTKPIRFSGYSVSRATIIRWEFFREFLKQTEENEKNGGVPF